MNGDLLARIAAERARRLDGEHLDVDVPSWSGQLVARYGVITDDDELVRAVSSSGAVEQFVDFLIKACTGLYLRGETGDLDAITDDAGRTVGYEAIAEKLGLEVETTREALRHVFGDNVVAISAHAMQVFTWMQDTSRGADRGLLGES